MAINLGPTQLGPELRHKGELPSEDHALEEETEEISGVLHWLEDLCTEDDTVAHSLKRHCLGKEALAALADEPLWEESPDVDTAKSHHGREIQRLELPPCPSAGSVQRPDSRLPPIRKAMSRKDRRGRHILPIDGKHMPAALDQLVVRLKQLRHSLHKAAALDQLPADEVEAANTEFALGNVVASEEWHARPGLRSRYFDAMGNREYRHYVEMLRAQAASLLKHFDADGDGALSLQEARALFRHVAGLKSQDKRNPGGLNRKAFRRLCGQPGAGLVEAELVQLLDAGGGALGRGSLGQGASLAENGPWAQPEAVTCHVLDRGELDVSELEPRWPRKQVRDARAPLPGEPPPWQRSFGRAIVEPSRGAAWDQHKGAPSPKSHRQRFREGQQHEAGPPRLTSLDDTVIMGQVAQEVRRGDADSLEALLSLNSLWAGPNPYIMDEKLKAVLRTQRVRFPILFVAAHAGGEDTWDVLTREAARQGQLQRALQEEVDGWRIPSVICLQQPTGSLQDSPTGKDQARLLRRFVQQLDLSQSSLKPILGHCLLLPQEGGAWQGLAAAAPLERLLELGRERWKGLVSFLVLQGGGFPHHEVPARMALVGTVLAASGCLGDFFQACAEGGDAPVHGTTAFAGLYLGLLKNSVDPAACLSALRVLLDAGLEANRPLTSAEEHWPLHAAARHDRAEVIDLLLLARADPFAVNSRGVTALQLARSSRAHSAIAALQRGAGKHSWVPKKQQSAETMVAETPSPVREAGAAFPELWQQDTTAIPGQVQLTSDITVAALGAQGQAVQEQQQPEAQTSNDPDSRGASTAAVRALAVRVLLKHYDRSLQ